MVYILSIALFFVSIFNLDTPKGKEHLLCKWSLIIGLAIVIFSYKLAKKYHWSVALLLIYICASAIYNTIWPVNSYFGYNDFLRVVIAFSSSKALIALISVVFIISLIKLEDISKLSVFFVVLTAINSLIVIFQYAKGNIFYLRGGLFDNISINGCIIASCYPLLLNNAWKKPNWINILMLIPPVIAIFVAEASVGVGVLAVAISVFLFTKIKNIYFKLSLPLLAILTVLAIGYFTDKNLFDDSKRFGLYKIQYEAWKKQGQIFFGYGTGTYRFFGTKTQMQTKYMLSKKKGDYRGDYNLWLHNDWLQLLLENGIVGMILMLIASGYTLFYAWKTPHVFACLMAFMSSMLFHYPIHYPIHAIFGLWLVAYSYLKYNHNKQKVEVWRVYD